MHIKHDFPPGPPVDIDRSEIATPPAKPAPVILRAKSALVAGAALAAIWQGLHWGDPASWIVGGPAVIGGALVSFTLPAAAAPRVSPTRLIGFACFSAAGVLRGALDVGLRSLRPGTLAPAFLQYTTLLPEGRPRRMFALFITLMPGTLTVRLDGPDLVVHALDRPEAAKAALRQLETRIAELFGLDRDGEFS